MAYGAVVNTLGAAVVAMVLASCASTEDDAPISQRAGRSAAASVPAAATPSSTVRGGMSTPTGP